MAVVGRDVAGWSVAGFCLSIALFRNSTLQKHQVIWCKHLWAYILPNARRTPKLKSASSVQRNVFIAHRYTFTMNETNAFTTL